MRHRHDQQTVVQESERSLILQAQAPVNFVLRNGGLFKAFQTPQSLNSLNPDILDMITREESITKVMEYVKQENLVNHMIAVGAIMNGVAERLEEDQDLWEIVGILHDIDYEDVGEDWDRHGLVSADMVSDLLPEEGLKAIRAHNPRTGVLAETPMEISLLAADGLSGLVVATGLMMPDKKLASVKVRSLKKKFKDKSFARGVNRENIMRCEEIGIPYSDFLTIGLEQMKKVSDALGL
jgi:putative nucleotidyltransferase with HDIG domain